LFVGRFQVNTSKPGVGIVLLFTSDYRNTFWGVKARIIPKSTRYSHRHYFVEHGGNTYSTISDIPIEHTVTSEWPTNTQVYYAPIPHGWALVENISIVKELANLYQYGADMLVAANGTAIMVHDNFFVYIDDVTRPPYAGGQVFSTDALLEKNGEYRCIATNIYFCQILIVKESSNYDDDGYSYFYNDDGDGGDDGGSGGSILNAFDNVTTTFRNIAIIMIISFLIISGLIYMYDFLIF